MYERYEKLRRYLRLKSEGCREETILEIIEVSKATVYRWLKAYKTGSLAGLEPKSTAPKNVPKPQWKNKVESLVLQIRRKYKFYGKYKLHILLHKEHGILVSISRIGRILKKLISKGLAHFRVMRSVGSMV